MDARASCAAISSAAGLGETELLLDTMTWMMSFAIGANNARGSRRPALPNPRWLARGAGENAPPAEGLVYRRGSGTLRLRIMRRPSLRAIEKSVAKCTRCRCTTALNPVPGRATQGGSGVRRRAPGANDDVTGRPVVGAAVNLLNKSSRCKLRGSTSHLQRPPASTAGNRNPLPTRCCLYSPLVRQIEDKPKVMLRSGVRRATFSTNNTL